MNLSYLQLLLDYHYWARDRMFAAISQLSSEQYTRDLGNSFPSVQATVNHLYFGEWVWFSRWRGTSPMAFPPQESVGDLVSLRAVWSEQEAELRGFIASKTEAEVAAELDYILMNGNAARSKFWEMFAHLVNHATYHRGQVTTMLRQLGAKPPESTDMIAFFRMRST